MQLFSNLVKVLPRFTIFSLLIPVLLPIDEMFPVSEGGHNRDTLGPTNLMQPHTSLNGKKRKNKQRDINYSAFKMKWLLRTQA